MIYSVKNLVRLLKHIRVKNIVHLLEHISVPDSYVLQSIGQLLEAYPDFKFVPYSGIEEYIWHDIEKKATPDGVKNRLLYQVADVLSLHEKELLFLIDVHNTILKILCVISAKRNMKLFLSILECVFGMVFSTGGDTPCVVRRIIIIYRKLGGVQPNKKREADDNDHDHEEAKENDEDDAEVVVASEEMVPYFANPDVFEDLIDFSKSDFEDAARRQPGSYSTIWARLGARDAANQFNAAPAESPQKKPKFLDCVPASVAQLEVVGPPPNKMTKRDHSTNYDQKIVDEIEMKLLKEYGLGP